jgi:voltage-gated potassium channel Kch
MVLLYPIAKTFGYCNRADASLFAVALSQAGEFAFVLFGAASKIIPPETASILNAVVATSMLTTPLLVMVHERVLMPRFGSGPAAPPDAISESNPVIVAGFGRFGQVVVRVLRGLNIGATVIDQDPTQIETVRRFGYKAYYGDATRLDLLESAGAGTAKVLLLAIDDPDAALEAVKRVRERFPKLEIVARARGRTDAYEYAALGVPAVREVFGSALQAAAMLLKVLGYEDEETRRIVRRFREYDERQLAENAQHRNDMTKLIALSEQGRRDIAQLLAAEAGSTPQVGEDDARRDPPRDS